MIKFPKLFATITIVILTIMLLTPAALARVPAEEAEAAAPAAPRSPRAPIIDARPLTESFDDTTFPPAGWTEQIVNMPGSTPPDWTREESGSNPTIAPHSGAGMAKFNSYDTDRWATARLVTPALNLPAGTTILSFWMAHDDGMSDPLNRDFMVIEISLDGGADEFPYEWGPIYRYDSACTTPCWRQHVIDISAVAGQPNVWIALSGASQSGNNMFVDDLIISTPDVIRAQAYSSQPWPCGSTWASACDLRTALANAAPFDEIWVGAGIHVPGDPGDRAATFTLRDYVGVYGGFDGTETARDQRDWAQNVTVLSGDIDVNDNTDPQGIVTDTVNIVGDNSYHVVNGSGTAATAVLDGFVVTAGEANGGYQADRDGAGLYIDNGNPTLRHLTVIGNLAYTTGGGMYLQGDATLSDVVFQRNRASSGYAGGMQIDISNPTLTNVTFQDNVAYYAGGGLFSTWAQPTLTNITFQGNVAGGGGGMGQNGGGGTLTNATFRDNEANFSSGGGGLGLEDSSLTLNNVLFAGNKATAAGGGIWMSYANLTLINVTLSGNLGATQAGGVYVSNASVVTLTNCIVWGNEDSWGSSEFRISTSSSVYTRYSTTGEGGCPDWPNCWNTLGDDPLFVDPVDASQAPTLAGDYHVQASSGTINAGDNSVVTASTDLDGNPRISGGTVDQGAYEKMMRALAVTVISSGDVTSSPAGINCPSGACSHNFVDGQQVTLTATPVDGFSFVEWIGDCSGTSPQCTLTMTGDKSATARFSTATTLAIDSDDPDPSLTGQPVTVHYTVVKQGGGTPDGNVTVTLSGDTASCVGTAAAGSCTLTPTGAGVKTLTASFAGAGYNPSQDTEAHTINKADTTTTITGDTPDPSVTGQGVVVHYSVVANAPGGGTPAGNVTVVDSDGNTCTATVAAGSCTITPLLVGAKTITATYAGDASYNGSQGTAGHTVSKANTTTAITGCTPPGSVVGQPVVVHFSVTAAAPGSGTPTGAVTVADGHGNSCAATAAAGNCTITPTQAGDLTFTATYGGDANYNGSQGTAAHTVDPAETTTAIISITPEPSKADEPFTVTYSVTVDAPGGGAPAGSVTITLSTQPIACVGPVPAGSCVLTPTIQGGATVTATYGGGANFNGSTANASHLILRADLKPTLITITADLPDPSVVGQPVLVQFTVDTTEVVTYTPTGNVTVIDGEGNSCQGTLVQEQGSCSLRPSRTGVKTLTAVYNGDARFNASQTSTPHTVTAADSTTSIVTTLPNPSIVGRQPVKVYYSVAGVPPGGRKPTGLVTVVDNDGNSCGGTVVAGVCQLTPALVGSKVITATYAGDASYNGSQGTGSHFVTDVPIQGLALHADPQIFFMQTAHFSATVADGTNVVYRWDPGDGTQQLTGQTMTHEYATLGTYTVTVFASNLNNQVLASRAIAVEDVPISGLRAEVSDPLNLLGETVVFTAEIDAGTNVQYSWNYGDGTPPAPGQHSQHVYAIAGVFTPTVEARNAANIAAVTLPAVRIVPPLAGLSAGSSSPALVGQPAVFTATVTAGQDVVYTWDFNDGTPPQVMAGTYIEHAYAAGGHYQVTVTATSWGQQLSAGTAVDVQDMAIIGLSAVNSSPTAVDTTTYFTASVSGGTGVTYVWNFGDGSPPTSGEHVSHSYDPPVITDTVAYTASVVAINSVSRMTDTTEVGIYLTPPQTRQVGAMRVTANRFRDMGNGMTRASANLMFADGRIRVTGPSAFAYYGGTYLTLSGRIELRTSGQSLKVATGQFRALLNGKGTPQGRLTDLFTQLSGFAVSGVGVAELDLVNASARGSVLEMRLNPPNLDTTAGVRQYTITTQGDSLHASGDMHAADFTVAGVRVRTASGTLLLTDYGVQGGPATLTMPSSAGGGTTTTASLRLAPDSLTMSNWSVPTFGGASMNIVNTTARLLAAQGSYQFSLQGSLQFKLPQNGQTTSFNGSINTDGSLGFLPLSGVVLNAASLKLTVPNAQVVSIDAGLNGATSVMQMPANLGSTSTRLDNVTMSPDALTIGGDSTFDPPDFGLLSGALPVSSNAATVTLDYQGGGFQVEIAGRIDVKLPGQSEWVDLDLEINPSGQLSGTLSEFEVDVAFFALSVEGAEIKTDGTVHADTATLGIAEWVPKVSGLTATVYNVEIDSEGLSIGGGEFTLPSFKVGTIEFVDMGGKLVRTTTGYDIGAWGGLKIGEVPGQTGGGGEDGPSGGGGASCNGLWVKLVLGWDDKGQAVVNIIPAAEAFQADPEDVHFREAALKIFCTIPIDETGFSITEIRGSVVLTDALKISLGMTIESDAKVPDNPFMEEAAMVSADVDATLIPDPFSIDMLATVKLFGIFDAGKREAKIWHNDRSSGFRTILDFDIIVLKGKTSMAAWYDDQGFSFAASDWMEAGISESAIGEVCFGWFGCIGIPPFNLTRSVLGEVGRFTNDDWGLKAKISFEYWFCGDRSWDAGVYINTSGDVDWGNVDGYVLMTPEEVAAARRALLAGGPHAIPGLDFAPNGDIVRDVTVGPADTATFILGRTTDKPTLTLRDPQGAVITPDNLPANTGYGEIPNYHILNPLQPAAGTARLRFVQAAPGLPPVHVVVNGAQVVSDAAFGAASNYQALASGAASIQVIDAGSGQVLASLDDSLASETDHSLALSGLPGALDLTLLEDDNRFLPSGEARVRLVNLAPMTTTLALHDRGIRLVKDVAYRQGGKYVAVDSGPALLQVRGTESMALMAALTDTLAVNGEIHTLFALPATGGEQTVQALFQQDTSSQPRLRFTNAGPDQDPLDVWSGDTLLFGNVAYTQTTSYAWLDGGEALLRLTPAGISNTTLLTVPLLLAEDTDYTMVAADGGGSLLALTLLDDNTLPDDGQTQLRLVNVGSLDNVSLQTSLGLPLFAGVGYNTASDPAIFPGDIYTLEVRNLPGDLLLSLPDVELRDGQDYTLFLFAAPGGGLQAASVTDLTVQNTLQTMYLVDHPQPGVWQAVLSGDPTDQDPYIFWALGTAASPSLGDVSVSHIPGEPQAEVDWQLTTYQPDTRLGIYANRGPLTHLQVLTDEMGITTTVVVTNYVGTALAHNLTLTDTGWITNTAPQSYTVDLSQLPSGDYHLWMETDDGRNTPLRTYAPQTITIPPRSWEPTWTAVITATAGMRSLDVAWLEHPDPNVDGYEVELASPVISGTWTVKTAPWRHYTFTTLEPNVPYTVTVLAVNGLSGEKARSQPVVVTPQGALLTLAADPPTVNLEPGQSTMATLWLGTPLAEYPEPVSLSAARPSGLVVDLPTELVWPTTAGTAIPVVVTATANIPYGVYDLLVTANGVGAQATTTLTIDISGKTLAAIVRGPGNGSMVSVPPGIECGADCAETFNTGTVVTLTGSAVAGSTFTEWGGDCSGAEPTCEITMSAARTVYATFVVDEYTLGVGVDGAGSVMVDPVKETYSYGDVVTLTAAAGDGWTFAGWAGSWLSYDNPLVVTMEGSAVVTATFFPIDYDLTVAVSGSGHVDKEPDKPSYTYNDVVTLTAVADPGWSFVEWSGALTGPDNPAWLTIAGNTTVTATFSQEMFGLDVTVIGGGRVTKEPDEPLYTYGTVVTLTAVADPGWKFAVWGGDCSGSDLTCVQVITGTRQVTATFTQYRIYLPLILRTGG